MSQENVNIVLSIYEAFTKGDVDTVLSLLDPQVEWNEAENFIYADDSPYIGPSAVLEGVFMRIGAEWDNFSSSLNEIHDAGETVVAQGYYSGTYIRNGRQVRAQFAHLFTLRNRKVVKFQQYTDTAQFTQAVGHQI
jgi:uncharacterized protein